MYLTCAILLELLNASFRVEENVLRDVDSLLYECEGKEKGVKDDVVMTNTDNCGAVGNNAPLQNAANISNEATPSSWYEISHHILHSSTLLSQHLE